MIKENDSILVFEYFTASGEKEKNIISEAEELIFALLDDLSDFNVDLVINKSYEDIVKDFSNVNPILIDENIVDWLEGNAADFKNAIFIAAETKHIPLQQRRASRLPINMKLTTPFQWKSLSLGHLSLR